MPLSVSLLDTRVASGEDCAHGCTQDILSVHCTVHGFAVDRVRVKDLRTGAILTGEVTLLEGIHVLGMLSLPGLDLVRADDTSRRVHWTS